MIGYKVRVGKAYVRYVSGMTKNINVYTKDDPGKFLKKEEVEMITEILGPDTPITIEEYDLTWEKIN